jgi:uncharacterized protein (DUF433 family)
VSLRQLKQPVDARATAAYGLTEASHYLRMPVATLRSWVLGRHYPSGQGKRFFQPLIAIANPQRNLLSFLNLVEAHVLCAIRRDHQIALQSARRAVTYIERELGLRHPLASQRFETDGVHLFVEQYGKLINASDEGQLALRALLSAHLRRIEWDQQSQAARLFPFTRKGKPEEPRLVVIDPRISFGRPVLAGTGIPTAVIAERYKAGESMEDLARDYARTRGEIEEAVRCELPLEAA